MFTRRTVWEYGGTTGTVGDSFQPAWCMGSVTIYIFYYTQCITHVYRHLAKLKEKVCCTILRTDTHLNTFWEIKPRQRLTNLASFWCYHCAACSAHVQYAASGLPIEHLPLWVVDSISPYIVCTGPTLYWSYLASFPGFITFYTANSESWWHVSLGTRLCMYRQQLTYTNKQLMWKLCSTVSFTYTQMLVTIPH